MLLNQALVIPKTRRKTNLVTASVQRRLTDKKRQSERKQITRQIARSMNESLSPNMLR